VTRTLYVDDPASPRDGEILEVDIEVNSVDFALAVDGRPAAIDLASAAAHEIGHALGLEHNCGLEDGAWPTDQSEARVPNCESADRELLKRRCTSRSQPGTVTMRSPEASDLAGCAPSSRRVRARRDGRLLGRRRRGRAIVDRSILVGCSSGRDAAPAARSFADGNRDRMVDAASPRRVTNSSCDSSRDGPVARRLRGRCPGARTTTSRSRRCDATARGRESAERRERRSCDRATCGRAHGSRRKRPGREDAVPAVPVPDPPRGSGDARAARLAGDHDLVRAA